MSTSTAPSPRPDAPPPPAPPSRTAPASVDPGGPPRSRRRTVLTTIGWWLHGAARVWLALALLVYGLSKIVLLQFGQADLGDALIPYGQMSPMGLLWRMVGFSPLFQILSGVAEAGAGAALLWRRTVPLGALLGLADMVFVFVLNLCYDVPVKQLSGALALLSLIVLAPWLPRVGRAVLGHGALREGPWPRLLPWRRADRVAGTLAAIAAVAVAVGSFAVLPLITPKPTEDISAPTGVWSVQHDARPAAAQLAEDTRIQQLAFGQWDYGGRSQVSIRRASGEILRGTYTRTGPSTVHLELRPLRMPGQSRQEIEDSEPLVLDLAIAEQADGHLRLTGTGEDLLVAEDPSDTVLYDRGFSWAPRPDDPFNR